MNASDNDVVWYVAYGSNLDEERLLIYLTGGDHGDANASHVGARDSTPPTGNRLMEVPGSLWFGGPSRKWNGGAAHLDDAGLGRIIGRAWRVTVDQLADITAQENGHVPGSVKISARQIQLGGIVATGSRYGRIMPLPALGREPAVTLSFIDRPAAAAPSVGYLETMVRGLRQCALTDRAIERYLSLHAGVSSERLSEALDTSS